MKLRLQITTPSNSSSAFDFDGELVRIGRDPECELKFQGDDNQQVSWKHARIQVTHQGLVVTDLESSNGTFVNGKQINSSKRLNIGDLIQLGTTGPQLKVAALEATGAYSAPPSDPVRTPTRKEGVIDGMGQPALAASPAQQPAPLPKQQSPQARSAPVAIPMRYLLLGGAALGVLLVLVAAIFVIRGLFFASPGVDPNDPELPKKAFVVLKTHCYKCHGGTDTERQLNILDKASLYKNRSRGKSAVAPNDLDKSIVWTRMEAGTMPPPHLVDAMPTAAEKNIIKAWILGGAKIPSGTAQFKSHRDVMQTIHDHLTNLPEEDRRHQRYFTLANLYNNKHFEPKHLRMHRAALSKLVNSMSWRPKISQPKAVDPEGTVFSIDLRKYNWQQSNIWRDIERAYPYGLRFDQGDDDELTNLSRVVYVETRTTLPAIRADWFIANASQPPLYHIVLELPNTAGELERLLKVNFPANFSNNNLVRAGFNESGVSKQNRLIERHPSKHGAYWKSYDFISNEGFGHLVKFPLGPREPVFPGNPFVRYAFKHDGGEMIFNLPNGLQGYFLTNAKDERIDVGPIDVVRDKNETSGSPKVVNGLSCMSCHVHGMIRNKDIIRDGNGVDPQDIAAIRKIEHLYPVEDKMIEYFEKDEKKFAVAVETAIDGFVARNDDPDLEQIGFCAKIYLNKDLSIDEAAAELGIDAARLKSAIESTPELRELGLAPLAQNEKIKRAVWESLRFGYSVFQLTARELRIGSPLRPGSAYKGP